VLQITGDPGKIAAFQRSVSKFGIKEVARTGKVSGSDENSIHVLLGHSKNGLLNSSFSYICSHRLHCEGKNWDKRSHQEE
jgi:hypothetical protein